MIRSLNIKLLFCVCFFGFKTAFAQTTIDTVNESISIYAKTGITINYTHFQPQAFYSGDQLVNPIGEIGCNVSIDKVQLGLGVGYYAILGSNPYRTSRHQFYIPLSVNVRLFNLKRNLLSVKGGLIAVIPASYIVNENTYKLNGFGLASYLGLKYSRLVGSRILLSAEADLGFSLFNQPSFDDSHASLGGSYYPGYSLQIGFEYFFGKKRSKYLLPSQRKKK